MGLVTRDAVIGHQMMAKIKLRVYDTILEDLKLRVALFTPRGTVVPCIERFGSWQQPAVMTFAIVAVLLGSLGGGGNEGPVQYHPMFRCDNAIVGSTMKAKIKLRVYDAILKDLKLRTALFTPEGHIVPCIDGFGSW
ncbi:hypothetical protein HPB49_020992 [Dermacentor silvarum]|uniref:Uncharacterized protein n=1 Tax=Dermacentor silvarum TaxID=543639 RepID=A0ACB8C5E6_DERSI|nr:hypothetical protein HPB49_020992 [Dermacentor silvarum]